MSCAKAPRRCSVESLESRLFFSLLYEANQGEALHAAAAKPGGGISAPPIRLDIVALHEFGHSLGLGHSADAASIMYAYYNPGYNLANFSGDSAVAAFRSLYASESTRPWKDALDADGGVSDGDVDLTYSFVLDGARMDQGSRSNAFATFNRLFGAGSWEAVFATELQRWASASNGRLQVRPFDADGIENAVYGFNASGAVQNDSRLGDVRIGAHKFDGAGKVLAHTYYPPPNGITAAGDSHYDAAENWVLGSAPLTATLQTGGASGSGALTLGRPAGSSPFSDSRLSPDEDLLATRGVNPALAA